MQTIIDFLGGLFGAAAGVVGFAIMASIAVGSLYWLWMAIQLGSFLMFALILFPPSIIITAPVGIYSILFGPPDWVLHVFG